MNRAKSIVFIVLAAFLFVGSIGVSIFSKVCAKEGVNISYFVPGKNECCERESENESCGDCCTKDKEESKDDCCSTSSELVKVHLDFLNKIQVKAILSETAVIEPVWISDMPVQTEEISIASGSDPPPKPGQELLIDFQQWLI